MPTVIRPLSTLLISLASAAAPAQSLEWRDSYDSQVDSQDVIHAVAVDPASAPDNLALFQAGSGVVTPTACHVS